MGSRRSSVSALRDSYGLRVRESLGVDHAQSLRRLALPEGRSVRCLLFSQLMASVILGALFPTQFVRRDLLRPSSAITLVQSGRTFRCALRVEHVDRADAFCYSCVLVHSREVEIVLGGSPSASWEDSSRQSQAALTLLVGMTRCEAIRSHRTLSHLPFE